MQADDHSRYIPETVALWVRISSDRAGDEHGVKDQEFYLREQIKRLGWSGAKIIVVRENDVSASRRTRKTIVDGNVVMRTNRPELLRLIRMIHKGEIDGIVVRSLDRALRNGNDMEDFIAAINSRGQFRIESIHGHIDLNSAMGRAAARIFAAMAIAEAEQTSERITDAKARRAAEGDYRGGPRPYGFEPDGKTIRDGEARVIRWAALELIGGATLASIAREMTAQKMPMRSGWNKKTVNGTEWKVVGLRQILLRGRNAGLVTHETTRMISGKEVSETVILGHFQFLDADGSKRDPILSEDEWRQVCAILNDEDRRTSPGPKIRHLGTHIYLCGRCHDEDGIESKMVLIGGQRRGAVYSCSRKAHLHRNKENIDSVVEAEMIDFLSDQSSISLLRKREDDGPDHVALSADAAIIRRKLFDLEHEFENNPNFSMGAYKRMSGVLQDKLDEITAQMEVHPDIDPLSGIVGHTDAAGQPDVAEIWNDPKFPIERKRDIIKRVCKVFVYAQAHKQNQHVPFDPDSVEITWLTESDGTIPAPRRQPEQAGVRGDMDQPLNRLDYPRTCEYSECGKAFRGAKDQKFCSYDCYDESRRGKPNHRATTEKTCEWCGEAFQSYHANHQRFCSEPCRRRKPARKQQ